MVTTAATATVQRSEQLRLLATVAAGASIALNCSCLHDTTATVQATEKLPRSRADLANANMIWNCSF